jgi:small subunit ribosomal protein S1
MQEVAGVEEEPKEPESDQGQQELAGQPADSGESQDSDQPQDEANPDEANPAAADDSSISVGDKVSGVLTRVGEEDSFVDFGGAAEGKISSSQLRDSESGSLSFDTGDPLEAYVAALEDGIVLSREEPVGAADLLYKAYKAGTPVNGRVVVVNKWGLGVDIGGIRGFCPVSLIDVDFVKDTASYRDQELEFKITRFKDGGRTLVLSRRALLQDEQGKEAEEIRAGIQVGARLEGTVTRIQPYGAFVDLGAGVEGLIHVSEFKHERVEHPQDVVKQGAQVTVAVVRVQKLGDRKAERISLSLKALIEDPWDKVKGQFSTGSVVDGKVEALEEYGAMVVLADDVRGMIHVSEIAEKRIAHPREVLSVGESVRVAVIEKDDRRRRLRLSLRRAEQVEDAANLREFKKRDEKESKSSDLQNALTDALKRARLA